jgi:hypothetical protein
MATRTMASLAGVAFLLSVSVPLPAIEQGTFTSPPTPNHDTVWLRQTPWTEEEQARYYHLTSGTQLIPYSWFIALQQADTAEPFKASDSISRLRLVPDKTHPAHNRDRLPVGFTRTVYPEDPQGIKEYLGITCAFCHTGELHASTKDRGRLTIYIEGGASMQDNAEFLDALGAALRRTAADDAKFSTFASAVLQHNAPPAKAALRQRLAGYGAAMAGKAQSVRHWGFGRFDALNRGSNLVFTPLDPAKNAGPLDAPVSIPPLWNVQLYDWVQWNGSFQNPLTRNIAQVIGIGAGLFRNADPRKLHLTERPPDPFLSSLDVARLQQLEDMVSAIKPPHWPETVFGEINERLAREGKKLYRDNCKHCHVPTSLERPTRFGQRFKMTMIPAGEVGTDPTYLKFASRMVYTGVLEQDFGSPSLPAGKAIEWLTSTLAKRSIGEAMPNRLEMRNEFMARPHAGVWATPPFLHNGSIPTLYEVLSPVEERTPCFYLGDLEFDPVHVGYVVRPCRNGEGGAGLFRFDTTVPGNSNAGHEFRRDDHAGHTFTSEECKSFENGGKNGILGCELSGAQRLAIIEYLKTCDLDEVTWDLEEAPKICEARRSFLPE